MQNLWNLVKGKAFVDKFNLIKMKNFCFADDSDKDMKRHITDWEKIIAIHKYPIKDFFSKYTKKINSPIKNQNRYLINKTYI